MVTDCALHVHLVAFHDAPGFESGTPGLGVMCRDGDWSAFLGSYRNSIKRHSNYVGVAWQPIRVKDTRIGVYTGLVSGYYVSRTIPVAGLAMSYSLTQRSQIHSLVIPKTPINPATFAISYSVKFK